MEIKEQFTETPQVGLIIESDELTFVVRVHTVTVFEVTPDIDLIVDTYGIKHIRCQGDTSSVELPGK